MVIEYYKKHVVAKAMEDDVKNWDADFMNIGKDALFELIMAADYLDVMSLLDLICQIVADMIKGKTPEEICQTFSIQNDFTPEEEDKIRSQSSWAFSNFKDII